MSATILLIDDDVTLLELLADHLRAVGYQPLTAPDGPAGLRLAADSAPDLVVLDVMMPGMSGWEVCERLRTRRDVPAERLYPPERLYPIPIIMLTAKGEEVDKLRGFRLGVDDYVTKPFSFAELVARVGAVLVRASRGGAPAHSLTTGDLTIDFDNRRVTLGGQPVELTPIEYRLLENLARRSGHTVPTETLITEVWGTEYAGEADHVKHYVWTLRKKIEADPGDPKHLITERGFGYRFE
ncbi:MAG: response regulator transcription factor [Chloroflexi bacterium]|nr:response regulator transcription factor [Chloroflexota bacterium]